MFSITSTLLLVHLLGVVTWVGGSLVVAVITARLVATGDRAALASHLRGLAFVGPAVLMPGAALTLVGGIGLMGREQLDLQLWLAWGLGAMLVAFALGAIFMRRAVDRVLADTADGGAARALVGWNVTILLVLFSAVAAMVFKPTL